MKEPTTVRFEFGPDVDAPARARRALQPALRDVDHALAADVRLVLSELVSNVVRHTRSGGTVRFHDSHPGARLRLEVIDGDAMPMSAAPPCAEAHGLMVVDAIADAWGVDRQHEGHKVVWAVFDLSRRRSNR